MTDFLLKLIGLVVTVSCWIWARDAHHSTVWTAVLIWIVPWLQFPITLVGRALLHRQPTTQRAQTLTIVVHYSMMIVLGASIFLAIRVVQEQFQQPHRITLPVPLPIGRVLVMITLVVTTLAVLNLAIRGLGAPFAAKLSSRLATDWMYSWTRNPMVLCTFALLLSVGVRYQSLWFVVWLVFVATPGWLFFVRKYEERELEIRFGESYKQYREKTPFLWPRKPRGGAPSAQNPLEKLDEAEFCDHHHTFR